MSTIQVNKIKYSPQQLKAINHSKGHLCIIACPGSGKTEVVSRRVAQLIKNGEDPETIVSFTFTEKAADELKIRIRKILEDECPERSDFGDMYVGTIHSFCLRLLKDLDPNYRSYSVLDDGMRVAYVTKQQNFYGNIRMKKLRDLVHGGKYKTVGRFLNTADIVTDEGIDLSSIKKTDDHGKFKRVYERYRKQLTRDKYFDFGTVIEETIRILRKDRTKIKKLGKLIKHLTVDEYQDVNTMQESLVEFVSKVADSVCVVGDDDQNIYNWRGADVKNILNFQTKYSKKKYDVTTVKLETNYRSTPEIIETSRGFIECNNKRLDKKMMHNKKSKRKHGDGDIIYNRFATEEDEFEFIYKKIIELKDSDHVDKRDRKHCISLGDIAILVRTNTDAARILAYFDTKDDIECVAYSGKSIFEMNEVRLATDCISYVFGCTGYSSIVNSSMVGGESQKSSKMSKPTTPKLDELKSLYTKVFRKSKFKKADAGKFAKKMKEIKKVADAVRDKPPVEVTKNGKKYNSPRDYLPEKGLQLFYHNILNAIGAEEFDLGKVYNYNLAVLSGAVSDFELVYTRLRHKQISEFPWFVRAFGESNYSDSLHNDPTIQDAVSVLTIHKAKGLEFPVVFVPCFNDAKRYEKNVYTFLEPDSFNYEMYSGTIEDVRRTWYTALTRSEKYLSLTCSEIRSGLKRKKKEHRCLPEIPKKHFSNKLYTKRRKSGLPPKKSSEATFPTSFSQLNSYERCPKDYQLRHIYGYNAGVPAQFGYGTNIHNMLNIIFNDYIEKKKIPTTSEIKKRFEKMWTMRYATTAMSENARKKAEGIINKYIQMHSSDFDRVLKTEKNFEFVVGDALIAGVIDLLLKVDKSNKVTDVEIIDFKSGEKIDGEYQADHEKQLRYYATACRESLDLDPQRAFVQHLSEDDPKKAKTEVDISDKHLKQTRDHIEKQIKNVIARKFAARPRSQRKTCDGCDYKRICCEKEFDVKIDFKKD